jgi:hypothetical protein
MGRTTKLIGAGAIVTVPVLVAVADELRMAAEGTFSAGLVNTEYGVATVLRDLAAVEANRGLFTVSAAISYSAVLLLIPALVAIWRLSVRGAPRWAWTGAVMAALGVCGSMVHLAGYHGMTLTALDMADREAAAEFMLASETTPFVIALFAPFFLTLLCPLPQAIGLLRARVIPLWACLSVVAGAVLFAVLGSTPWSAALAAALLVAGFAPAALALVREGAASGTAEPVGRGGMVRTA